MPEEAQLVGPEGLVAQAVGQISPAAFGEPLALGDIVHELPAFINGQGGVPSVPDNMDPFGAGKYLVDKGDAQGTPRGFVNDEAIAGLFFIVFKIFGNVTAYAGSGVIGR